MKPVRLSNRRANAPLRMGIVAICGAGALALSACSAGQVTATDGMVASVPGSSAEIGDIALREVKVQYDGAEGYAPGDVAPLVIRIFNSGVTDDRLTGVTSPAGQVTLFDPSAQQEQTEDTATDDTSDDESTDETGDGTADESTGDGGEDSATGDGTDGDEGTGESDGTETDESGDESATDDEATDDTATEEDSATDTTETQTPAEPEMEGSTEISVDVPSREYAMLLPDSGMFLQIEGLSEPLVPGGVIEMTFEFESAGPVTMSVPMDLPLDAEPRTHFEPEEGTEEH